MHLFIRKFIFTNIPYSLPLYIHKYIFLYKI